MDTRDMIIETAFKGFLDEGFDNVSLNSLVKKTELSKGAFYHHFVSKSELINEIVDRYLIRYVDDYVIKAESFSHDADLRTKLDVFFGEISTIKSNISSEDNENDTRAFFLLLFSALKRDEVLKRKYLQLKEIFINTLDDMLSHAIESGEIREQVDSATLSSNIYTLFRGTMFEWAISGEGELEVLLKENISGIIKLAAR